MHTISFRDYSVTFFDASTNYASAALKGSRVGGSANSLLWVCVEAPPKLARTFSNIVIAFLISYAEFIKLFFNLYTMKYLLECMIMIKIEMFKYIL